MPDHLDSIMDHILSAAETEMKSICEDVEQDIRQRVGEPYPPASQPGSAPHRRTGGYQDGFAHEVLPVPQEDRVEGAVTNESPLSTWLEKGTKRGLLPRPHFQPTFEEWAEKVPDRLARAVNTPANI